MRPVLVLAPIIIAAFSPHPISAQEVRRLFYHHPDMERVSVRTEVYKEPDLEVDLFFPVLPGTEPIPVVVFVFAFPDTAHGPLREYEPYPSWARLMAAEGFVGVLYETDEPESDLEALFGFLTRNADSLGIDAQRIGLWSCSANTGLALKYAWSSSGFEPAAFVGYYGRIPLGDGFPPAVLDSLRARATYVLPSYPDPEDLRTDLPMYILRAGLEGSARTQASIDDFVQTALQLNLPITVRNYPEGHHGFDFRDDTPETRWVIRQTLEFLRESFVAKGPGG